MIQTIIGENQKRGLLKNMKCIDLTLSVLAVLVGRHVVDGVARRAVGRRAVGLGAGQRGEGRHGRDAGETLQALDVVHALAAAGRHASRGLQAARQRRDGVVALRLVGDAARVQQTHHLKDRQTIALENLPFETFKQRNLQMDSSDLRCRCIVGIFLT